MTGTGTWHAGVTPPSEGPVGQGPAIDAASVDGLTALTGYDVATFGAVGDGVTDDTAAIVAAINAAHTAGGGVVELAAATYLVSASLVLPVNVSIRGAGRASWLKLADGSNCPVIVIPKGIETGYYGTLAFSLRSFAIDGNAAGQGAGAWYGVELVDGDAGANTFLVASDVWVQNTVGDAWYVGAYRNGNRFERCDGWGSTSGNGWTILSSDNVLLGCSGGQNAAINLYVNNWLNIVVGGWYFQAGGLASVELDTLARYNIIDGLGIDNNAQRGISILGDDNIIQRCVVQGCSTSADGTYAYIEVGPAPHAGNIVRDCVATTKTGVTQKGSAALKLNNGAVGVFGPIHHFGSACNTTYIGGIGSTGLVEPVPTRVAVINSIDESITNNLNTAITFDTVTEDVYGAKTAADTLTIPSGMDGVWDVMGEVRMDTTVSTAPYIVSLYVNGAVRAIVTTPPASGMPTDIVVPLMGIRLAASDTIKLYVKQTSGGALACKAVANMCPRLHLVRRG